MNKRQKILMYEALASSKLLYALESLPISTQMYNRIDAAYLKGLRQILEFKTTFGQKQSGESMTNSNQELIRKLSEELSTRKKKRQFRKLSERIIDRAITLLGKVIRKNPEDPMHEVIMAGDTWNIPEEGGNRTGRPCTNWLIETAQQAWRKHNLYEQMIGPVPEEKIDFNYKCEPHVKIIIQAAKESVF